ncbi:ATP-binding protein, partial [Thermodesulfovibrionales bacterium]|nr:ATP-binding protein [Thermodesulfovibrionales bacterium]
MDDTASLGGSTKLAPQQDIQWITGRTEQSLPSSKGKSSRLSFRREEKNGYISALRKTSVQSPQSVTHMKRRRAPFYIPLSTVNTLQFYRQLSQYLSGEDLWRKSDLFQAIQTSIRDYVSNNKKVPVIIFDKAHLMKNENFYELQLITNFSMDSL